MVKVLLFSFLDQAHHNGRGPRQAPALARQKWRGATVKAKCLVALPAQVLTSSLIGRSTSYPQCAPT
jgi:hypothetical protein